MCLKRKHKHLCFYTRTFLTAWRVARKSSDMWIIIFMIVFWELSSSPTRSSIWTTELVELSHARTFQFLQLLSRVSTIINNFCIGNSLRQLVTASIGSAFSKIIEYGFPRSRRSQELPLGRTSALRALPVYMGLVHLFPCQHVCILTINKSKLALIPLVTVVIFQTRDERLFDTCSNTKSKSVVRCSLPSRFERKWFYKTRKKSSVNII